jgi:hypothetical protein
MAKEEEMEKVKALIHMGKKKGFLTYDEVNNLLPPDIVSSDQIDDLMMMFGEMDIESSMPPTGQGEQATGGGGNAPSRGRARPGRRGAGKIH